jgi:hypothetical protein
VGVALGRGVWFFAQIKITMEIGRLTDIVWDAVRLPGIFRPSGKSPYRFNLKPSMAPIARASFDKVLPISKSSALAFNLHSPTSKVMFPDIVRGDYGFPTICIKNQKGTVYRFARGNLKDFFDIANPNRMQTIRLPINAFEYDRDLKANVPDEGTFFRHPIVGMYFDFLCHPIEEIDIELGEFRIDNEVQKTTLAVHDLVIFERTGQAHHYPAFSSQMQSFSLGASLNNVALSSGYSGSTLHLSVLSRVLKKSVALADEA